jgi:diguanylate cyclase (GGDEF)-like protein/PAS domain S-box-containing protein
MYHFKNIKRNSIKTKVIFQVTILIAIILINAIGFILYLNITKIEKDANFTIKNKAENLIHDVEQRLGYLQESTELLGTNELLINSFIDGENRDNYLLALVNNFKKDKYLNNLSIVDFDGRVIFQTDNSTPKFKDSQELRLSLNLAQTVSCLNDKKKEVIFIVPIKYYGATQGAIITTYNIRKIIEKYNQNEDFIYIKFLKDSVEYYTKNYSNSENYYKYKLSQNNNHKILHNLNLKLEMGIAKSVYLKPFYTQVIFLSIFGLIILTLGMLVSYFLATAITNPILTLYNKVTQGKPEDIYEPLGTADELEILGYAYYQKEKELSNLNKNLHIKVQEATKELQDERNRFSLAVEGSKDGLWDWNIQTDELFFSERFEIMLGYNVGDLPRNIDAWFGLLHPDDKDDVSKAVQDYLNYNSKSNYEGSFRLRAKDGSWIWILGRGKALFDTDGTLIRFVGFNTDISQQKEYQKKLDHTAKHDSLTHLPNRFLLSELLTHEMHIVKRNNKQLALCFIDLDGFKEVNDKYGHEAGDEVLSTVASRMSEIVRESDIVSRLGGDEFVIVISNLKSSSEVIPMLQRLLSDLSSDIPYNKNKIRVSASIGVSFYPQDIDIGNEALLRQADQAMYDAKLLGKNQYQFFNVEASCELKETQTYISNLRQAIYKNQFVLYYQPKVNMKTNKVIGLEALLRWNHPEEGLLYPDSFLPFIKQESSFMLELGKWVFESAFSELESWHLLGLDIALSINVSSYEIQEQDFSSYLKKLFSKHPGIKPNTIEIELLETAAFENFELTSRVLDECQELGVSIAIDDFGTGYASLHYLKKLPMNVIKIDRSFVMDLLYTSNSISIIEASIGLARAFDVDVIAEGVESEEHGKVLLQLGCEVAQGYAIAKAMPAKDVVKWIQSYKGFTSWTLIKPMNEASRTILYASVEHLNWIYSIKEFIENKTSKLPELEPSKCYLGKWITNNSTKKQRDMPEFEILKKLHSNLHDYAEKLLISNKYDKSKNLEKLKTLHQEIIEKLELLATKL